MCPSVPVIIAKVVQHTHIQLKFKEQKQYDDMNYVLSTFFSWLFTVYFLFYHEVVGGRNKCIYTINYH